MTAGDEIVAPPRAEPRLLALSRLAIFAAALSPIVLFPHFFFPFVSTRNVFFRWCVELAVAAFVISGVRRLRNLNLGAGDVLPWLFAFFGALSLSAVFGLAPWHSVFGDFERMGGVFAWLHLLLFYFVLRAVMREGDWRVLFRIILIVADLVVVWGSLEFLPAAIRNPLFQTTVSSGSTIGNPGLLAPYLLLSLAAAGFLVLSERSRIWQAVAFVSSLILLFGIAASRNRSSELGLLFGFAVGIIVLLATSEDRRAMSRRYLPKILVAVVLFVVGWFGIVMRAPEIADRFGGRWIQFLSSPVDYSRTIEWKIALRGFHDRPVFGYGPENHQIVASHHFDPNIYGVVGEGVFDRTHNVWLELLATTGIVGTATMLGIWLAAILTIRRGIRQKRLSPVEASLLSGVFAAYAVYLTFWFFDLNSVMIWIALLAFLSFRVDGPLDVVAPPLESTLRRPLVWAICLLIALAAYLQGAVPLRTARALSAAAEPGTFERRLSSFEKVFNSSAPQTMHTFPLYYRFLRSAVPELSQPSTSPLLRKELDLALQRGAIEAQRSVSRNSEDDRAYVDAARFYSLAGLYYSDGRLFNRARLALLRAIEISPRRPDSRILLSGLYSSLGDTAKAVAQMDTALLVAPKFAFGYMFAARLMVKRGNPDSSASLLESTMSHGFLAIDPILGTVVAELRAKGHDGRAAKLVERFLERRYGPISEWKGTSGLRAAGPLDKQLANQLPILYLKGGDLAGALRAARGFALMNPAAGATAARFGADIRASSTAEWSSKRLLFDTEAPLAGTSSTRAQ